MSIKNIQLVKWSFPALALIIGLFWYKRRRVDRVDPGGIEKTENKTLTQSNSQPHAQKTSLNFSDSDICIDESLSSTLNNTKLNQPSNNIVCSPRRVSESLDIPTKNSSPHSLTGKSNDLKKPWHEDINDDIDDLPEMSAIVLGSNPKSSNFDLMALKTRAQLAKIADDDAEEGEPMMEVVEKSQIQQPESQSCMGKSTDENKTSGQVISERDSANHSPVSGVLDGSVNDEVRSEGSTDSGKGGSINGQVSQSKTAVTTFAFEILQKDVGKLIGKRGASIQNLNTKANVTITVKRHPTIKYMKLCIVEGLPENITMALDLVRQVFPVKKYPELTLEQVNLAPSPEEIPWVTDLMHLQLVEGVNNDVLVCHIMHPNRLFIQMPTHPTHPSLRLLDYNMTHFYNTVDTPAVPDELTKGMVVVTKWYDKWVRAYVEEPDAEGLQNLVRLVDHGGFWTFSNADMRKIRSDYLTLPFQAIEVSLANIMPAGGEWPIEAYEVVAQICSGSIGQAQIVGYIDSVVYIDLYINFPKHGVLSVAEELLARGLAEPVAFDDMIQSQSIAEVST